MVQSLAELGELTFAQITLVMGHERDQAELEMLNAKLEKEMAERNNRPVNTIQLQVEEDDLDG
jgi:hypothetical protein